MPENHFCFRDMKECRECGVAEYIRRGRLCRKCKNARNRDYYWRNKEEINRKQRAHYQSNRQSVLDRQFSYYWSNRERIIARNLLHYHRNSESINAKSRARYHKRGGRPLQIDYGEGVGADYSSHLYEIALDEPDVSIDSLYEMANDDQRVLMDAILSCGGDVLAAAERIGATPEDIASGLSSLRELIGA